MSHYDEHILELYVLGAASVKDKRPAIEEHLYGCRGCAGLVAKMSECYAAAEKHLERGAVVPAAPGRAMVRTRHELDLFAADHAMPAPVVHGTRSGSIARAFLRYPVAASIGGIAAFAALLSGLFLVAVDFRKDVNPAYVHMNPESARIEVYNRENEMLWSVPSMAVYKMSNDAFALNMKRLAVADLDGDGENEVVTALPLTDKESGADLTVFSPRGKVEQVLPLTATIDFRGVRYPSKLSPDQILVTEHAGAARRDILVTANGGRSPNILYRLGQDRQIVGSYYHFGLIHLSQITGPSTHAGKILVYGENDEPEPDSIPYPLVIVADLDKITGAGEAADSRGFNLPPSTAEEYVIRFPLSDMNEAMHAKSHVSSVEHLLYNGETVFIVHVAGGGNEKFGGDIPHFDFILHDDMSVAEVKPDSHSMLVRERLAEEGLLAGVMNKAYLDRLAAGVRYWDGERWVERPCRVRHQQ